MNELIEQFEQEQSMMNDDIYITIKQIHKQNLTDTE
tara:strand:+ start:721 stop:828 length:108 start_codon:yes stop_codon:yes gene_type:complete